MYIYIYIYIQVYIHMLYVCYVYIFCILWLVGGIPTPLKNMSSSIGMIIPNVGENQEMFQTTNQKVFKGPTYANTELQGFWKLNILQTNRVWNWTDWSDIFHRLVSSHRDCRAGAIFYAKLLPILVDRDLGTLSRSITTHYYPWSMFVKFYFDHLFCPMIANHWSSIWDFGPFPSSVPGFNMVQPASVGSATQLHKGVLVPPAPVAMQLETNWTNPSHWRLRFQPTRIRRHATNTNKSKNDGAQRRAWVS